MTPERRSWGTGKYPDDIYLDGMIYGSAVRSKYPRARVLAIHKEKAEALPGVVGVYTADDIPGKVKVGHLMQDWDTMIPVGKITHYLGDAICLVAAETPEILEKAKKLVEVEYEPLKPVFSPTYAASPLHRWSMNPVICCAKSMYPAATPTRLSAMRIMC